jgi:phage tail sheath protein FI
MAFQISPGINTSEIDLTTIVPTVGTTVGAIAGPFRWGPANKPMLIDSELTLVNTFGKPDNNTANTWFTAANFLAYGNALQTVRVVKESVGHKNATADGSGVLISNDDVYLNNYANGQGNVGMFAAKYPGDLGNSLTVSMADANSFNSWPYKMNFTSAPGTSTLVANGGGSNDELHIVVIDSLGWWTGEAGTVLEPFPFVSKCAAAKYEDGSTIYYPEVINRQSKYVWWMDHPTSADLGLDETPNWGSSDFTLNYVTMSKKIEMSSPVGSFTVGEVVAGTGAVVSSGSGAVLGTPTIGSGGILTIPLGSGGSGYLVAPNVIISGTGTLATATAVLTGNAVTSFVITNAGVNYTGTPTATVSSGSGCTASCVVNGTSHTVTGVNSLVAGSGYTSVPTITFTDDGSTHVTGHAILGTGAQAGTVTSIVIDNPGIAVTTATVAITAVGSGATAGTITLNTNTIIKGTGSIAVVNGGSGYVGAPTVSITGGSGNSATATCHVTNGIIDLVTVTAGGTGYTGTPVASIVPVGSGATAVVEINNTGRVISLTPVATGSGYSDGTPPTVVISGPGVGANITVNIVGGAVTSYTVTGGGVGYETTSATVLSWADSILTISPISGTFTIPMELTGISSGATADIVAITGGEIDKNLSGGVDANDILQDGDYQATTTGAPAGYAMFQSGEDIDVSLVLGADADQETALYLVNDIAEYRKDCVTFLSPPLSTVLNNNGNEAVDIIAFRNLLPSSSYAVMDSGWKYQYDKYNDIYRWVPLNGDVAGLCVRTDTLRDPWWSPAGYNRGMIQNVVRLAWNPRQSYRDMMYSAGINAVISQAGQGTLLYGDKTMLIKPSAFDRINVRRLFIVLEKSISAAAKYTLFEFNDAFTQAQFVNMVSPYLSDVMGRRGIYDFRVVCDSTNNTPTVVDANQFIGDIYVKPARSINFIQLNFVAVRTGVDFSEIVGQF